MAKYEVVIPLEIEERAERPAYGVAAKVAEVVREAFSRFTDSILAEEGAIVEAPTYQRADDEALHDRSRDRMERDYWSDVRGVAEDFVRAAIDGEFEEDEEDARTWLHETIDSHRRVFVTALAQECLRFSPNDGAHFEQFGADGAVSDGGIEWSRLAFSAFEADVLEEIETHGVDPFDSSTWHEEDDD